MTKVQRSDKRRWKRWMERISDEITSSEVKRYVFERWHAIVKSNTAIDINNRFIALIWSSYFEGQAMMVRRQAKNNKQSISLVRLLQDIATHHKQIMREKFLESHANPAFRDALYRRHLREAAALFDTFAGRRGLYVSKERVLTDIQRLCRSARRLEYFSDKWIAHSDRKRRWPRLSFDELNKTLDLFSAMFRRCRVEEQLSIGWASRES